MTVVVTGSKEKGGAKAPSNTEKSKKQTKKTGGK